MRRFSTGLGMLIVGAVVLGAVIYTLLRLRVLRRIKG